MPDPVPRQRITDVYRRTHEAELLRLLEQEAGLRAALDAANVSICELEATLLQAGEHAQRAEAERDRLAAAASAAAGWLESRPGHTEGDLAAADALRAALRAATRDASR